jgi:hypothetical protein
VPLLVLTVALGGTSLASFTPCSPPGFVIFNSGLAIGRSTFPLLLTLEPLLPPALLTSCLLFLGGSALLLLTRLGYASLSTARLPLFFLLPSTLLTARPILCTARILCLLVGGFSFGSA